MTRTPFVYELIVRLHDADAAGVIFYGHLFRHFHDAYESFMDSIGFPLHRAIRPQEPSDALCLPIMQANAELALPLRHGMRVRVLLEVEEVRERSFAIVYRVVDSAGQVYARGRTLHVLTEPGSGRRPRLPEGLRQALGSRNRARPSTD